MIYRLSFVATGTILAVTLALHAAPAHADVKPGDVITKENVNLVADLVSPAIVACA
jgi:hypothetical protein